MANAQAVALVVPVLDEEDSIATVIGSVPPGVVAEIIVVDGGSRDRTVERARAAGARVIASSGRGYGLACKEGADAAAACCSIIAFIDGDGSDDAGEIARIVAPIAAGEADFVIGSRSRGEREPGSMSAHQLLAGRLAGFAMGALYGVRYTDMCPLRAIGRTALEQLGMRETTYGWNLEMQMRAARAGLRIVELPVRHHRRIGGVSKVAGSVTGTLKASRSLATTFLRVAAQRRRS